MGIIPLMSQVHSASSATNELDSCRPWTFRKPLFLISKISGLNGHLNRENVGGTQKPKIFFRQKNPVVFSEKLHPFLGPKMGFFAMIWKNPFHPCQMVRSDTEKILDRVNPGLINPVYGCLIGRVP